VCLHVVEHLADPILLQVLDGWTRVLRPGGHVLVVTPNLGGAAHRVLGKRWSAFKDPTHVNLKSRSEWVSFFTESQHFEVVMEFADGYYDFPYQGTSGVLKDVFRAVRTLLQFVLGRAMLKPDDGENLVLILEKV